MDNELVVVARGRIETEMRVTECDIIENTFGKERKNLRKIKAFEIYRFSGVHKEWQSA